MALGYKKVETRSWTTTHRGWMAIHAAKGFPREARRFAEMERALGRLPKSIPLGAIVAVGKVENCLASSELLLTISALEKHLGNYAPGRFGWVFSEVISLPEPLPCSGRQRVFHLEEEFSSMICSAAGIELSR